MRKKDTYIEVETNKRSYGMVRDGRVAWEKGERVVRIEPKEREKPPQREGRAPIKPQRGRGSR